MMKTYYLGIDLGTSAVKAVLTDGREVVLKEKADYPCEGADGFWAALCHVTQSVSAKGYAPTALSLSSQVGTYLTDRGDLIPWHGSEGEEELEEILARIPEERFLAEIGMRHPRLVSYPLPRLLFIKRRFPEVREVMMPKDYLIRRLTGEFVTDFYSWRGLCHAARGEFSHTLLEEFGLSFSLPTPLSPTALAGSVSETAARETGLPVGLPVTVGLNDFYAALLGMGVVSVGDSFEVSGTSEHLGYIGEERTADEAVSSPYLTHFVTYGGTKASGTACKIALRDYRANELPPDFLPTPHTPVFLPYLAGERAPVYDTAARGVFFGLDGETTPAEMGYAMLEGVVFSLAHIAESISLPRGGALVTGGGSAKDRLMAEMKAELLGCEVRLCRESDSSAFGAAMLAAVGDGMFAGCQEAAASLVRYETIAIPCNGTRRRLLAARYEIYKSLYPALREGFSKLQETKELYE